MLSDEALRANYDSSGKDSVEAAPKVDPSTLFAMIFGSEKFVPLVGTSKYVINHNNNNIIAQCGVLWFYVVLCVACVVLVTVWKNNGNCE